MYSPQVLDHFEHPRFAGDLENATVVVNLENPACGDRLRLALRVEENRITDVRFKAKGCVPSIACASRISEIIRGMDVQGASHISEKEIAESLGGLPEASAHASHLAVDALREALRQVPPPDTSG